MRRSRALPTGLLIFALLLAFPAAGADKAQQYMEQGSALVSQKRHLEAIQAFTLAIQADPKQAEGYRKRAISRKAIGDYKEAIKDYDRAIELDPTSSRAYNGRGEAKLNLKDREGAIADINKAVELDPENANARINQGRFNEEAGNLPGALASYNHAIKADPKNGLAWLARGNARAAMDDDKGAIADYTEVIKLDSKLSGAANNRGAAKERLGDLEGAAGDYRKELEIDPDDRDAKGNLARVQGILDERTEASRAAKEPAPALRPGRRPRPRKIDTATWLPKVLKDELPNEPCNVAKVLGEDVPWKAGKSGAAPGNGGRVSGGIEPFDEIAPFAATAVDGPVSVAIEGMRLLLGPMTREQEETFNKRWLPMRDYPSEEVLAYCNQLNPLLGQLLSLRAAMANVGQGFDDAWEEATTAAVMEAGAATVEGLGMAKRYQEMLAGLQGKVDEVSKAIEALGSPPNPWAQKCEAARQHREALDAFEAGEPVDLASFEGDWEGVVEPPVDPVASLGSQEPVLLCIRRITVLPVTGSYEVVAEKGLKAAFWGARLLAKAAPWMKIDVATEVDHNNEYLAGFAVYASESGPGLNARGGVFHPVTFKKIGWAATLTGNWDDVMPEMADHLSTLELRNGVLTGPGPGPREVIRVQRAKGPDSIAPGWTPADSTVPGWTPDDMARWEADRQKHEENLRQGIKDNFDDKTYRVLSYHLWARRALYKAFAGYHPEQPAGMPLSEVFTQMYVICNNKIDAVEESVRLNKVQPSPGAPTAGQPAAATGADRRQLTPEEEKVQQEQIAYYRQMIADSEHFKLQAEKDRRAATNDPEKRAFYDMQIMRNQKDIQTWQDQIESVKTGQIVYTRTDWDDMARGQLINKMVEDKRKVDTEVRGLATTERFIAMMWREDPEMCNELRAMQAKTFGPKTLGEMDPEKTKQVVAAMHAKVDAYFRGEYKKAKGDEAWADFCLDKAEKIKKTADASMFVCSLFGGQAVMATYEGITGTIEGGIQEGALRAAAWCGTKAYVASEAVRGWQEGKGAQVGAMEALGRGAEAYILGKAFELGVGAIGRLAVGAPALQQMTVLEAAQLAGYKRLQQKAKVTVGEFEGAQKKLQDALATKGTPPAEIVRLKETVRDKVAAVHESPEAKMFLKKLAADPSIGDKTRKSAEDLTRAYSLHLSEIHREVAQEFNQIMTGPSLKYNRQNLREFRNSASAGTVGMDHDIGLVEQPWFERDLLGRKKFNAWLTKDGNATTVTQWQKDAEHAWAEAYKKKTGRDAGRSWETVTTSVNKEAYRDLSLLGTTGSKGADVNRMLKGWSQQTADVTTLKALEKLHDGSLTQAQGIVEASRGTAKDLQTKLIPMLKKAAKDNPGQANKIDQARDHWWKVVEVLEKAQENPIEAMYKLRILTGGKDLVQVNHEVNGVMTGMGKAIGR